MHIYIFSLILETKVNAVEGGTTSVAQLNHEHNQPTHVTDGVTVTSLSATSKTRQEWPRIIGTKLC